MKSLTFVARAICLDTAISADLSKNFGLKELGARAAFLTPIAKEDESQRRKNKIYPRNYQIRIKDLKIADLRYDYALLLQSKKIYDDIDSLESSNKVFEEAKLLFPNYFQADGTT